MAQKIEIVFEAGTDQLIKSLGEADKAAVRFSGTLTKSFSPIKAASKQASNSIKDGFNDAFTTLSKGVAIGNLVSTGILNIANGIKSFVTGSVAAAQQQEDAINRLSQALRTSGSFSQQAVEDFEEFASALQKASVFGDEVVLGQLAIAKSFGATNEQAKQLVQAAANLSATFGGTLEERVQQLGKTFSGSAGRLGQLIPQLNDLTASQLKASGAADLINKKFAGAAANELNTYSGRVTALSNAYSDLQEQIGAAVTENTTYNRIIEASKGLIEEVGQAISLSNAETKSQNQGFVDSQKEINILSERYAKVRDEIERYQTVVDSDKNKTLLQSLFSFDNAPRAKEQIKALTTELNSLQTTIARSSEKIQVAPTGDQGSGSGGLKIGKEELAERTKINEALKQQRAEFDAFEIQSRLAVDDFTTEQRVLEFERLLEFENQKVEAIRQAEVAKAQLIQDEGARKLEIQRANEKAQLDTQKNTIKSNIDLEKQLTTARQQEFNTRLGAVNNFLQAGLALSKENSAAQKALAITQATISTYQGATNALADTRPAFLGPAVAASIVALGLANVARIAGAKFAQGGIVGGTSTQGDRVPALLNSREMVLNMGQQRELFDMANGSSRSNSSDVVAAVKELAASIRNAPIIVQANGREIARLIRDEQRNGFEVLA